MTIFENSVSVVDRLGNRVEAEGFGYDSQRKFFIVYLASALSPGQAVTLSVDFLGNLNDDLSGFYRSSYFDQVNTREEGAGLGQEEAFPFMSFYFQETNTLEYIATTQFEATYARRALPCFDEPALKAK
jgi:aminopeptidase N